jgi:two-component system, chemotaxis family, chemotaxis protein CheY
MRALVIDDSLALRRILEDMLAKLGFEVAQAPHGRAALEWLAHVENPDVVLVDWNMPEMNGLEFVQAVRRDERYADVPLMMVTTEAEMERITLALEAGVNEYIMKPFDQEAVQEKLQLLGVL